MWKYLSSLSALSHFHARDSTVNALQKSSFSYMPWPTFHLHHFFSSTLLVNLPCKFSSCSRINVLNIFPTSNSPHQSPKRTQIFLFCSCLQPEAIPIPSTPNFRNACMSHSQEPFTSQTGTAGTGPSRGPEFKGTSVNLRSESLKSTY